MSQRRFDEVNEGDLVEPRLRQPDEETAINFFGKDHPLHQSAVVVDQQLLVRQAALAGPAGGTTRRLEHRGRVGIDADDEGPRGPRRATEDGPPVSGSEIDDHPLVAGDQAGDLADVHVRDAAADERAHRAMIARFRK